jgi:iron complex outermembrane receptor protein
MLSHADQTIEQSEQDKTTQKVIKLKNVVVTGTKEGEVDVQKVPSAITAYTAEDLDYAGINNIADLPLLTPGLNLSRNGQSARLYMRGIGSNLDFIGSDPSVTVHVDGVYQSRTTGILNDFLDVERVEVLRGPQGTLYGRNSTGGTINLLTKLPTAKTEAKVFAEAGSYNYLSTGGSLNGALVEDQVLGRIAVMKTDHDPYVKNSNPNGIDGLLDDDSLSSRGALRFLLDQESELVLRADYSDIDRNPGAYKTTLITKEGGTPSQAGAVVLPSDPWTVNATDVDPYTEIKNWGTSAEYTRTLSPELTLVSLTAYRDLDTDFREDTDGSNLAVIATSYKELQDQVSEELRLHYQGDRLSWVAGLYYLQENQEAFTSINGVVNFDVESKTKAYALFGQGDYAITPKLNASLGLRFSDEEKDYKSVHTHPVPSNNFSVDQSKSWNSWSPKLAVDYTYDSGTMVYGSVSRGFKSGGYNMTSSVPEFDPEYVWSYEVGTKMELLDNKLRTNVSVFYYDYTDLQVQDFVKVGVLSVSNAAEATVQGFEIENQWMPFYDVLLELDYAYLHAEYDKYITPFDGDVSGHDLIASPRHKINLATQFFHEIKAGTLSYRFEYSWQDDQFFTAPNQDVSKQTAYSLLNMRLAFNTADEKNQIQFFGENLTNKAYSTSSREFPSAVVGVTKDINPPRTFGVKFSHSF